MVFLFLLLLKWTEFRHSHSGRENSFSITNRFTISVVFRKVMVSKNFKLEKNTSYFETRLFATKKKREEVRGKRKKEGECILVLRYGLHSLYYDLLVHVYSARMWEICSRYLLYVFGVRLLR